MWKVRYYVPLIGFIVPTLVIGYGFVIPCSCIAGVNELSVGFGSTVLGAALTYFAGIRTATRTACPARAPWRVRVARYLNRQASHPRGLFGRLLGVIWTFEHRNINDETLELLEIAPTDRVLEVGSGPGWGLSKAAQRAKQGRVTGLDVSEVMIAMARRRNRCAIRTGHVEVSLISEDDLGLRPESFDRAFSIHCIYFWKEPVQTLEQIARALRPGGRLALTFRADSVNLPARIRDETYRFYDPAEVETMVTAAGFEDARVVVHARGGESVVSVIAHRASLTKK
jgi:SAM-dependent methyltransferase